MTVIDLDLAMTQNSRAFKIGKEVFELKLKPLQNGPGLPGC